MRWVVDWVYCDENRSQSSQSGGHKRVSPPSGANVCSDICKCFYHNFTHKLFRAAESGSANPDAVFEDTLFQGEFLDTR